MTKPVSAPTVHHVQRLLDTAAAKGGTVKCVKRADGSMIFYVKQDLLKKPHLLKRDSRDILHDVLRGRPGPRQESGMVVRVDARHHLAAQLPQLFMNASAVSLARRTQA